MSNNRLALGTVQFGLDYGVANKLGQVQSSQVDRILSDAKKFEIDLLDTAIGYGASEEVLGVEGVKEFQVITKLPGLPKHIFNIGSWVRTQVENSLMRLRKKELYGLLLHRPQDLMGYGGAELIDALSELKNEGIVRKLGVSIYSPNELDQINECIRIDLVQAPVNVIDRRMERSGWLEKLKKDGIEVHARSVFLQGLLLMRRNEIPERFARWASLWNEWHKNLKLAGVSPLAACLAYPLSLCEIDRVIVGVDSSCQLLEIIEAMEQARGIFDTSFMASLDLDLINPANWNYI